MSFYSVVQGSVKYPNKETFNEIVESLKKCGWLDEKGYFVDECGNQIRDTINDPDISEEHLTINIPIAHYRNLSRFDFFTTPEVKGAIVGTSTDGCFAGWTIEDGKETNYDLEKWAAENLDDGDETPPQKEDFATEEDYWENFVDWQGIVEQEFITYNS